MEEGAEYFEPSAPSAGQTIRTSEVVDKLFAAIAKAQAKIPTPKKDRTANIRSAKGEYSYQYCDLATIVDAIRKPLDEAGLAIVQAPSCASAEVTVTTRVIHTSGQWIESALTAAPARDDIQGIGSVITYLRRYALSSMLGIATESDDDGASAMPPEPSRQQARRGGSGTITDRQRKMLFAKCGARADAFEGIEAVHISKWLLDEMGYESGNDIPKSKVDDAIKLIESYEPPSVDTMAPAEPPY